MTIELSPACEESIHRVHDGPCGDEGNGEYQTFVDCCRRNPDTVAIDKLESKKSLRPWS